MTNQFRKNALCSTILALSLTMGACSTDTHTNQQEDKPSSTVQNNHQNNDQNSAQPGQPEPVQSLPAEAEIRIDSIKKSKPQLAVLEERGAVPGRGQTRDMTVTRTSALSMVAPHEMTVAPHHYQQQDTENYLAQNENPVKRVEEAAVSTFSIDVDTAAYSNVRRMIMREGRLPPADAVKAEEFINYFSYQYPVPEQQEQPFSFSTEIAPSPWNAKTHLLQVGLKAYEPELSERPASNLVFLVDVSGSMQSPFKLQLVKQSLRMLVNQMNKNDRISLVVYAGAAGMVLEPTAGDKKATIMNAIDNLSAGGSTNGGAGIQLAYNIARQGFIDGGINRVIIASDGDMNVGTVNHEALKDLIKSQRESGIALSTLGYGTGNYNYALMEQLADVGNGNAAYIDSLKEAHKVLVKEMQSTLLTVAKDVKIQVEFNPAVVAEYRLIGYENRLLKREDFTNDKVDAGEIGAGHTVTALYEIAFKNSGGEKIPALRYGKETRSHNSENESANNHEELAFIKLRYKKPEGESSIETATPILRSSVKTALSSASSDLKFAAATAGFAQLLQGGEHTGQWQYSDAINLARESRGNDPHGYRAELITLVELAHTINQGRSGKNDIVSGLTQR